MLSLTFLLSIPEVSIKSVHAVTQSAPTLFQPFGPFSNSTIFTDYGDFTPMFTAFESGQVDLTDWPIFKSALASDQANANMFVTSQQLEYGIFQQDIQGHWSLLGVNQLATRTTTAPGLQGSPVFATGDCAGAGIAHIKISLVNLETGSSVIADPNNQVLLNFAKDGSTFGATGLYDFGCVVLSTLASNTVEPVSASVYSGIGSLNLVNAACSGATGCTVTATLGVNYASISNSKLTPAGTQFREGIAHLLEKGQFVLNEPQIAGIACATDTQGSPLQGLDGGLGGGVCGASLLATAPAAVSAECSDTGVAAALAAAGVTGCPHISLYNIAAPPNALTPGAYWWAAGGLAKGVTNGYASYEDILTACVHFVNAGLSVVNGASSTDCAGVANSLAGSKADTGLATPPACANGATGPDNCPHLNPNSIAGSLGHLWLIIRTSKPRQHFGQIIADTLNAMLGTPQNQGGGVVCYNWTTVSGGSTPCITAPTYYTIGQIATVVFGDGSGADCNSPINAVCDVWNMYTGGFTLGGQADHMYSIYDTAFGSNACGGGLASFPSNYDFHCDPAFDSQAQGGEFSTSGALAGNLFKQASLIGAQSVMTDPVYVPLISFGANNGYSFQGKSISTSLVSSKGNGWEAGTGGTFWSLFNMHQIPGYVPPSPGFAPGCVNPITMVHQLQCIMAGQSQDTDFLNIFSGDTVWDFSIMNQVYDSMLALVPGTGGFASATNTSPGQLIDWMTVSHGSSFNPTEITCVGKPVNPVPLCVQGTTTQTYILRPDIKFHDGPTVTAADVAYTILAARDVPASLFTAAVANVATDTCTGTVTATGTCSGTLQAIYGAQGQGCPTTLGATNPDGTPASVTPCQATAITGSGAGVTCPAPCTTLQVKLQGQSALFDSNIGGIPILPQHIWQNGANGMPGCGTMPFPAGGGPCSNPALDSMATGNFIGSGGYECVSSTGHVGGPCSSTGNQVTIAGATVLLKAYGAYSHGPTTYPQNSYEKFSWSDRNNEGGVGIDDLANAAVDFCISGTLGSATCPADAYWGNPVITGSTPGKVTAAVLATIALYFGISLTHPFSPGLVTNLDPNLDYYDYTGLGGGIFQGCPTSSVTVGATTTTFTCYSDSPPSGGESLTVADTNLNPIVACAEVRTPTPDPLNPTPGYNLDVWTCTVNNPLPAEVKLIYVPGTGAAASPFGVSRLPYYIFNH
jgi:hypothetical protein